MSRTAEALTILGPFAHAFTIREYQCDPEQCGHADSIILRAPDHIPVCFSLDELREEVEALQGQVLDVESVRIHFWGPEHKDVHLIRPRAPPLHHE